MSLETFKKIQKQLKLVLDDTTTFYTENFTHMEDAAIYTPEQSRYGIMMLSTTLQINYFSLLFPVYIHIFIFSPVV